MAKIILELEVDSKGAVTELKQFKGEVAKVPEATEKASRGMTGLTSSLGKLAVAAGAYVSLRAVTQFVSSSVSASAAQEKVYTSLAQTMGTVGVSYNKVGRELQAMLGHLQETTKYGDTDSAAALQKLIAVTGDYDSAIKLLGPTLDFASAMQVDFGTAARLSGQAASGMTGSLSRYGIILDDTTKKQLAQADAAGKAEIVAKLLNDKFGGAAQAELSTYAGRTQQLGNYWGDFKEAFGDALIKIAASPEVFAGLVDAMKSAIEWVKDLGEVLVFTASMDWDVLFSFGFDGIKGAAKLMVRDVLLTMSQLPDALGGDKFLAKALELSQEIADLADNMDRHLGPAFDAASKAAAEFRDQADGVTNAFEKLGGKVEDNTDANEENAESILKVGNQYKAFAPHMSETERMYYQLVGAMNDLFAGYGKVGTIATATTDVMVTTARESAFEIDRTFTDLLGQGASSRIYSFRDLWIQVMSDITKQTTGMFIDMFTNAFGSNGSFNPTIRGSLQAIGEYFDEMKLGDRLMSGIGGAMGIMQGYEQGGVGGFMSGAMGGSNLGGAIGGLFGPMGGMIGAGAGALIGGVISLFGGKDDPRVYGNLDASGEHHVWQSDTDLSVQARAVWAKERISEYRKSIGAMNDVLRLFGDGSLFDLVGDAPTFDFDEGDLGEVTAIFSNEWLPQAMRRMFRSAIGRGLRNFGVDEETRRRLWQEVNTFAGTEQIEALNGYIGALVGGTKLLASMDWATISEEVGRDGFTSFVMSMQQAIEDVGVQMLGLDSMTLIERAQQATDIESMITSVRQGELAMLQQLDSMQKGINQSIDSQLESIAVGGMDSSEQAAYYQSQITSIMAVLRAGGLDPTQMQEMIADLTRYTQAYQGAMGDSFYAGGYDNYISNILNEARTLSNEAFEGYRDEIQAQNALLIEQLQALIDALTHWGDSVATADSVAGEDKTLEVDLGITVKVEPNAHFDAYIEAKILKAIRNADGLRGLK